MNYCPALDAEKGQILVVALELYKKENKRTWSFRGRIAEHRMKYLVLTSDEMLSSGAYSSFQNTKALVKTWALCTLQGHFRTMVV